MLQVGLHCSRRDCHQLDFLPFTCEKCRRVYCLAHHKYADHECDFTREGVNQMPQCPICQQYVYIAAAANPDAVMNAHILSKCQSHLVTTQQAAAKTALATATKCDLSGCRNPDKLSTLVCKKCSKQYCLTHRLPESHRCSSLPSSAAATAAPTAASAAPDKHAKGNALLASLKAKREARAAAQAEHDRKHAAAFPTANIAAGASSFASSSSAAAAPTSSNSKPFVTLQQLRAGINAVGATALNVLTLGATAGLTPLMSTPSQPAAAAGAQPSAASSTSPAPSPSPSPRPQPTAQPPLKLTAGMKAKALGDKNIPESQRLYVQVDVTSIKSKRPPQLCFFSLKHSIGKVLDLVCDESGIENQNHLPNGKKLYLCCLKTNATFPAEIILKDLQDVLVEGDTLVLTRTPLEAK